MVEANGVPYGQNSHKLQLWLQSKWQS